MFAYCKGVHTDPDFQFYGTSDVAIINQQSGTIMFYSTIMSGLNFAGMMFYPPFPAHLMMRGHPLTAAGLRSLFELDPAKLKIKPMDMECMDELDGEQVLELVIRDLQAAPAEVRAPVVALARKIFSRNQ